jgi:hypothetical protein
LTVTLISERNEWELVLRDDLLRRLAITFLLLTTRRLSSKKSSASRTTPNRLIEFAREEKVELLNSVFSCRESADRKIVQEPGISDFIGE